MATEKKTCSKCDQSTPPRYINQCKSCGCDYCWDCSTDSDRVVNRHFAWRRKKSIPELDMKNYHILVGKVKYKPPFRVFICGLCYSNSMKEWIDERLPQEESEESEEEEEEEESEEEEYDDEEDEEEEEEESEEEYDEDDDDEEEESYSESSSPLEWSSSTSDETTSSEERW